MSDTRLSDYTHLLELTQALLALARAEAWDTLLDAIPAQQAAMAATLRGNDALSNCPADIRAALTALIKQIDTANREVLERVTAWRTQVSAILEEINATRQNGKRISRAYGG
ncbi:hypothetical protein [Chitinimonas sp. BJB300]|uniref:hypothetical protein n=1 Tax=Chitinimonas sp. BJB300 TaxID=1559339 RepID=UPI00111240C5|nr:hypothetical protein [Chitinimonas sp. BJB300]TSJ89137.1 hypothetical protein FG002_009725 [Chitinimonas sp. BJB300]